MKSICLVMIVRNEAAVIQRCLESVKGIITHWVICDTGSSDDTRKIIQRELKNIPGTLHEDAWLNFGHNRSLAIARAKGKADYHLLLNADETLQVSGEFRDKLLADAYTIRFNGFFEYQMPMLVSDRHDWKFIGITHEYIHADTAETEAKLPEITVTHHKDGGSRSDKYGRDIKLLTEGLEQDPNNARYAFYLAQSYRDVGLACQSLQWYTRRVEMGGWREEVWYSLYQIARLQHQSMMKWPNILTSYLAAYQFWPARLEPIFHIAKYYRENQQYHLGYLFSRLLLETPYPDDTFFIERNIYLYELPMEYAICCYWIGKHEEAIRVNDEIIARPNLPQNFLETARKNRQYSVDAVGKG